MGVYVYCIKEDYYYKSSITGRQFENDWFKLEPDGTITVKGTYKRGYAWDGCSPKMKIGEDRGKEGRIGLKKEKNRDSAHF